MKILIKFVDRGFILKVLYLLLLFSALPIGEIALLLYLKDLLGTYLLLSAVAVTSLAGVGLAFVQIRAILADIRAQINDGSYPAAGFVALAGAFAGSVLLIAPGFVSDFLGLLLMLPSFRLMIGRAVTAGMKDRLKELYEYLKLYDL